MWIRGGSPTVREGVLSRNTPSLTVGLLPRNVCSRFLYRWRLQHWRILWFLRFLFRLVRREIFFVHVDDFHFRSELAIAAKKNFIARLLRLALITIGEFDHGARRQQMRLFVNCHPVVIDDLAGRGDRKA